MQPQANIPLLFRHAWLLFIIVTCVNGAVWWRRGQQSIATDATLAGGYRSLIKGWLIYGNVPWVVMGMGILLGGVPSTFSYFNPRNGPFVIVFYITVVVLWIATFHWLFFRGGAEALVAHPGLLNFSPNSPTTLKLLFILTLAGGVIALVWMIFADIQVPR